MKKSDIRSFRQAIQASQQKIQKGYFAILGTLSGEVLTGVSNLVYVTTFDGQTQQVINRRVPNRAGIVVFVGSDEYSANKIEILYTLNTDGGTNDGETDGSLSSVAQHGGTHIYPSYDTVWVRGDQFLPLLATPLDANTFDPANGLVVKISPGVVRKNDDSGWVYVSEQNVDLSSHVPGADALWVTLQAEDDGMVSVVDGVVNVARTSLTLADIPEPTGKRLWAIILEDGRDQLYKNDTWNDFLDLRFDGSGSGGVSDAADVTYTPVDVNDWDYLSDPGDVADALDQLASRIGDVEASSVEIDSDAANINGVNLNELADDPVAPGAGHRLIYAKADGMYEINSNGVVTGAFGSGTGGQYRQFVTVNDGSGGWEFVSVDDGTGQYIPVFVLQDLE